MNSNITGSLYLEAHSIGISAADRIKEKEKLGFIHSIFDRVINITSSKNNLISLVGEEIGMGPLNIVSNIPPKVDFTATGIKEGDLVTRLGNLIIIGENIITVSIEGIKLWNPKIQFLDKLQTRRIIISNIDILKATALDYDNLNGLGELISFTNIDGFKVSKDKKLCPVANIAAPHITALLEAISMNNIQGIKLYIKKIVGLGPGLTPAGDDMLVGLMGSMLHTSINFPEISINVKKINEEIISSISGLTTTISEEFLREASLGRVNEPIASHIKNMLISGERDVMNSANRVLRLGGTSGTDTAFGIILGFYLMVRDIKNKYNHNQTK